MLSEEAIAEYQKIYKKEFGKEISKEEASEQGTRLLNLMRIILKPASGTEDDRKMNDKLGKS